MANRFNIPNGGYTKSVKHGNFFVKEESEESESSSDIESRSLSEVAGRRSPISLDETDIDTLPDANVDKNVVRTKVSCHDDIFFILNIC